MGEILTFNNFYNRAGKITLIGLRAFKGFARKFSLYAFLLPDIVRLAGNTPHADDDIINATLLGSDQIVGSFLAMQIIYNARKPYYRYII